jgi:hypothetical protein
MIFYKKVLKDLISKKLKGYYKIASLKGRAHASYIFKDIPYKIEGALSRIAQSKCRVRP